MCMYVCLSSYICPCKYMQGQALQVFLLGGPGWAGPFAANETALASAPASFDTALPTKRRPDGEAGDDALHLGDALHVEAIHDAPLGEARHDAPHVQPTNDVLDGVSRDGALHTPLSPRMSPLPATASVSEAQGEGNEASGMEAEVPMCHTHSDADKKLVFGSGFTGGTSMILVASYLHDPCCLLPPSFLPPHCALAFVVP